MSQWGAAYLVIAQNKTYKDVIKFFYDADIAKVIGDYIMPINNFSMITGEKVGGRCRTHSAHNGIDFAAAEGTPVYAAHDGVVDKVYSYSGNCGENCASKSNAVGIGFRINNGDGTYSVYMHFSKKVDLKKGDTVKVGQLIGYVGNTGGSDGNHLHYEMRAVSNFNTVLNPRDYLPMEEYKVCQNYPGYN